MFVYLINIALILVWGFFLISVHPTKQKKALFCVISSFQWTLISGLRHFSVGEDTARYISQFNRVGQTSWSRVLEIFVNTYFVERTALQDGEETLSKDPGYVVFQKLVHIFTDDPQIYLLIVAAVIFGTLAYFIYKNSEDPVFSYILFSTLFYSFFAVTGIRQALATALVVFIGYELIKQKKLLKFAVISFFAFVLHKSALVFVLFYWISKIKVTWKYIVALILATTVGLAVGAPFILQAAELFGFEKSEVFEANTSTYTIVMAVVGIAVILFFKQMQRKGEYKNLEINATLLAVVTTFFALIDQSVMRVQQYYALFLMLSIPSLVLCFPKFARSILKIGCILILVVYLILVHPQYRFFWQAI